MDPVVAMDKNNKDNKDNRIQVTADRLNINNKDNSAEFSGNVQTIQDNWVILSDRLKIYYSEALDGKDISQEQGAVKKIIAEGNVTITSEGKVSTAEKAEYFADTQIVVLTGKDATISSDRNLITGEKITLDRNDENIKVEKGADKRVTAVFYSNSQTNENTITKTSGLKETQIVSAVVPEAPKSEDISNVQAVLPVAAVQAVKTVDLKKKIGVSVIGNHTVFDLPVFDDSFYQHLVDAINKRCNRCMFTKPGDNDYPVFLTTLPKTSSQEIDHMSLCSSARKAGLNAVLIVSVSGIFPEKESRGMMWFKKVQHMISIHMLGSVFDTTTASTMYYESFNKRVDIDETTFNEILSKKTIDPSIFMQPVEKIIAQMNAPVSDSLNAMLWKGSIVSVTQNSITLSSGKDAGLEQGNIFDVFDVKIIEGFQGQTFYMPGGKTGEIQIKNVYPNGSEAVLISGKDVKVDNFVKPR
jgi:lipopolysaccharide export system protein LptA